MSEEKNFDKSDQVVDINRIRPALRKGREDDHPSDNNRTDSVRPHELNRPIVIPTPSKRSYERAILMNEPMKDIPIGCFPFMSWMVLQLDIVGTDKHIRVTPIENKTIVIGRNPESAPNTVDVDLTPYVDSSDGVSRVHAALNLYGSRLELEDKNSTNGTSINGIRFNPNESHPIRSGDIIMFGQFQMIVNFTRRLASGDTKDTNILTPLG